MQAPAIKLQFYRRLCVTLTRISGLVCNSQLVIRAENSRHRLKKSRTPAREQCKRTACTGAILSNQRTEGVCTITDYQIVICPV